MGEMIDEILRGNSTGFGQAEDCGVHTTRKSHSRSSCRAGMGMTTQC